MAQCNKTWHNRKPPDSLDCSLKELLTFWNGGKWLNSKFDLCMTSLNLDWHQDKRVMAWQTLTNHVYTFSLYL